MLSWLLLAVAGCATTTRTAEQADAIARPANAVPAVPFFDARSQTAEYVGPGRDAPPPDGIEEIKIGWYGPADPHHPDAGPMWLAATLAIQEANLAGGCRGLPYRLLTTWSDNPWGSGITGVTRLAYKDEVWAVAGAPDGASAHLVEQVVAKARLTFLNPVSTDRTANLANVPWIFSCAPGDDLLAAELARAIVAQTEKGDFVAVSCTDHDSRMFTTELLAALRHHQAGPSLHLTFRPGAADFSSFLQSVRQAQPEAIALIAGPRDSARFLIALGGEGLYPPVYGGPALGRRAFAETAGRFAEGVVFPLLWHADSAGKRSADFARRFRERYGIEPDYTAAYTYDAMKLLIDAICGAGLNRTLIRDEVRKLSPWPGVTGTIKWDPTGHNRGPVHLGTIQNGLPTPYRD